MRKGEMRTRRQDQSDDLTREQLIKELRLYQVELQSQNETLRDAQDALQIAHNRYQDLYECAPIPYCTLNGHGIVLDINSPGVNMLGRIQAHIIGKPFQVVARVVRFDLFHKHLQKSIRSNVPVNTELAIHTNDGEKEIQLISTVAGGDNDLPMLRTAIIDVSAQRRAERETKVAERANSAKSEFLASMSHELRTPLNAILGFTQLLIADRKQPLSPRHSERVQHIERAGRHLMKLIEEVLDLSRIESGRMTVAIEPMSVADLLQDVATTLTPAADAAGIQLRMPASPNAYVRADRTRAKQVLINFGTNAIKYGRKDGKLELRVGQQGSYVRITVVDDGIGIPEEKQHYIFLPFQRAGRETGPIEGTGIGLALSKRLAEMMSGQVGFKSVENRGSEFWIELPGYLGADLDACRSAGNAETHSVQPHPDSRPEKARIVYVEDNAQSVALIRSLLEDDGNISCETALTAEHGVDLIRNTTPDLVLMDIHLPGMSGLAAASLLRQWPETRAIPLIALSAGVMPGEVQRIKDAGFDHHLSKPVELDELMRVITQLLSARVSSSSALSSFAQKNRERVF